MSHHIFVVMSHHNSLAYEPLDLLNQLATTSLLPMSHHIFLAYEPSYIMYSIHCLTYSLLYPLCQTKAAKPSPPPPLPPSCVCVWVCVGVCVCVCVWFWCTHNSFIRAVFIMNPPPPLHHCDDVRRHVTLCCRRIFNCIDVYAREGGEDWWRFNTILPSGGL